MPAPVIVMSPQGTDDRPGLTGLETMLWTEGWGLWAPPPTTLGGTRVEVQAWPAEHRWDTGDGSPQPGSAAPSEHTYVIACAGSEQEPPATGSCGGTPAQPQAVHVYETKSSVGMPATGAYTVRVTTVWHARYRVLQPSGPGPWIPLPERQTEASRPYRVQEVRSALIP
ncbi:MAG TPA: hypothetical protein VII47_10535 [Actinomycetota bacterium]